MDRGTACWPSRGRCDLKAWYALFKKKKPLPRDMTRVQKRIKTMKDPIALSPILSTQIRAYLQAVNETIQVYPMSTWNHLTDAGLTDASFKKGLNALVESGYGELEADAGRVLFNLTERGRGWVEGGGI